MRSLKKLLAVLLALTIVFSVMVVPTFAQSLRYEEEARRLYDLGLFKGRSDKEYVPDLESRLTREEGIAILLRIFCLDKEAEKLSEQEAKDILSQFSDADKVSGWALKYVAYAVKEGIVAGRTGGVLSPLDPLLGKEYATMLLRLLGYTVDASNYEFATADFATTTGFPNAEAIRVNNEFITRDDVVGMSYYTVGSNYKDGSSVIGKIIEANPSIKAKAIEFGLLAIADVVDEIEPITIKVGETYQLPATVKVKYTDGSEADVAVTWDRSAVKTDVAGEYKAYGTVAGLDEKIEVTIIVEPDVLAVESVTADNLKEVVVVFNQDVSENEEAAKKDNYTLNIGKKVTAVKVDGNTAVLTVEDGVANQTKAKLTVSNKVLAAKEEFEFTFFDAELPEVKDLVVTGPKSFELTFSEPIKNDNSNVKITIKSGTSTISINKGNITGWSTNVISVPLYSSFVEGKEYNITVEGFVDYAGYKNKIAVFTLVYEKDATAPVATIDEAKQEYVKVTFNKPVEGLTPEHFSHTFSAWTAMSLTTTDKYADENSEDTSTVVDPQKSYKTVYVWFYKDGSDAVKGKERPIAEGETTFRILTKANGKEIKDAWGNKFEESTYTISVVADKTAPEVKEVKVTTEQAFTVEFTKQVKFTTDNIEVLDNNGEKIDGLSISIEPTSADKKFTVDLGKNMKGKSIIVNIKNVADTTLNSNKLASYSTTLNIEDKTPPIVNNVSFETVGSGSDAKYYLYVQFNEEVDGDTALVSGNYYLAKDNNYTKLTETAEFFAGNKIVKIALTKAQKDIYNGGADKLFITSVKDVAGNEIVPVLKDITSITTNRPYIVSAKAVAVDKVEVTFNEELETYDVSAFKVNNKPVVGLDATVNSDGQTVITLTLANDEALDYNAKFNGAPVNVTLVATDSETQEVKSITNKFNVSPLANAAQNTKQVEDKIKPELDDDTSDVKAIRVVGHEIVIDFKEALTSTDPLMATDLVIVNKSTGKTLLAGTAYTVRVEGDKLYVNIVNDATDKDTVYKVSSAETINYIKDVAGNTAKAFTTAKEVTIKAIDAVKEKADSLDRSKYTDESWADLEAALALPEGTDAEIKAKVTAINEAIKNLVEKEEPEEPVEEPEEPVEEPEE